MTQSTQPTQPTRPSIGYADLVEAIAVEIRGVAAAEGLPERIDENTPLYPFDDGLEEFLDLDSLEILDVVSALEQKHGVLLPDDQDVDGIHTVGDLARALLAAA